MTILAIDTALRSCSVAVLHEEEIVFSCSEEMSRGQSERLIPMVHCAMSETGIAFEDLDAVAVTTGPGAFTGVRIGLSAARAFAVALNVPCLGFTTFDVMARDVFGSGQMASGAVLLIALDTKRDDIYAFAAAEDGTVVLPMQTCSTSDAATQLPQDCTIYVAGDAMNQMMAALHIHQAETLSVDKIRPEVLANLAAEELSDADKHPARPTYLRPPDVTIPTT